MRGIRFSGVGWQAGGKQAAGAEQPEPGAAARGAAQPGAGWRSDEGDREAGRRDEHGEAHLIIGRLVVDGEQLQVPRVPVHRVERREERQGNRQHEPQARPR